MISEPMRVAVAGALLLIAIDLADETVDVDDEPFSTRAGSGGPRPLKADRQDTVELADMTERERAQKRAQRGRS